MPKSHSGIRRGTKSGNAGGTAAKAAKTQEQELKKAGGDWVVVKVKNGVTVNASDPDAIEKLRRMAARNEVPQFVRGSRDDLGRWYEEFDRLYDLPSGDLGKYTIELRNGTRREIRPHFENDMMNGKPAFTRLGHDFSKASQAEISGAAKFAAYSGRDALERGLVFRSGGWPDFDLKDKYGATRSRVFSNAEKARIIEEMESSITRQLRSPLTSGGKRAIEEDAWKRVENGWVRIDT